MQLTIDFNPVHQWENNPVSQAHLEAFREKFNNDCYRVLQELIAGKRLSYKYAIDTGLSGDIRARIRDLRRVYGVPVSDEWMDTEGGRRFKEYYMTTEDKAEALKVLVNKLKEAA